MSEPEGTTAVLDTTAGADVARQHLTIRVKRCGRPEEKQFCFITKGFTIEDDHLYGVRHVLGLKSKVASVSVTARTNTVEVMLHRWQDTNEELLTELAKELGKVLGFHFYHIDVVIGRLK